MESTPIVNKQLQLHILRLRKNIHNVMEKYKHTNATKPHQLNRADRV